MEHTGTGNDTMDASEENSVDINPLGENDDGHNEEEVGVEDDNSRNSLEEPSVHYCLEVGLLFPLRVSLFPVKSSPSVLVDHGSLDPTLLMMTGNNCSIQDLEQTDGIDNGACASDYGAVELRKKPRRSLMRRRSTSVPDLDKLILIPAFSNHILDNGVYQYPACANSNESSHNGCYNHPNCIIECAGEHSPNNNEDTPDYRQGMGWFPNNSRGDNLLPHHHSHYYAHHPCQGPSYINPSHLSSSSTTLGKGSTPILITGAKSLPRIAHIHHRDARVVPVSQKSGSLATLPSFSGTAAAPGSLPRNNVPPSGHTGSIGDWMNDIMKYRQEGQKPALSSSEMLAQAVPLETVTPTKHKRNFTDTFSFQSTATTSGGEFSAESNKNSMEPSSTSPSPPGSHNFSLISIPRLNICPVESDVEVFDDTSSPDHAELSESSLRSAYSSMHRLFVIHGYDESEGVITISAPATPSRLSSRSRSGSFTGSETSGSFRIHSRSESPGPGAVPSSSSCCGVSLRGSPLPTSPPYQSACSDSVSSRHCISRASTGSTSTTANMANCTGFGGRCSDSALRDESGSSPTGSSACFEDAADVFFNDGSEPPSSIDYSFRARKKGIAGGRQGIIGMAIFNGPDQHPELLSREISDSLKGKEGHRSGSPKSNHHHQPLPGTKLVSVRKRSRVELRTGTRAGGPQNIAGGEATVSSICGSCKGHLEDNDKCTQLEVIMPTSERAKRLSRLIQHRQHLQLQYSLNLNFLVWTMIFISV